jgi:plastocyanin
MAGLAVGSVLLFAAACGGSTPSSNGPGGETQAPIQSGAAPTTCNPGTATGGGATIAMEDPHQFNPADVTIKAGESVTWTNNSSKPYTVTFDPGNGPDCGYLPIGQSEWIEFDVPGTYKYFDKITPQYMSGTITVTQ